MDATTMNIREKLDQLGGGWEDTVSQPYILKINPNMLPVNVSAVARKGYSTIQLSAFVEDTLLPQLEGTEGVAPVSASGMVAEQIQVAFRQDRIDMLNERIRTAIDGSFAEAEQEILDGRTRVGRRIKSAVCRPEPPDERQKRTERLCRSGAGAVCRHTGGAGKSSG